MESLANIYSVDVNNGNTTPTEAGHTPEWHPLENCIELLPLPYHKEAIKQYLQLKNNNLYL